MVNVVFGHGHYEAALALSRMRETTPIRFISPVGEVFLGEHRWREKVVDVLGSGRKIDYSMVARLSGPTAMCGVLGSPRAEFYPAGGPVFPIILGSSIAQSFWVDAGHAFSHPAVTCYQIALLPELISGIFGTGDLNPPIEVAVGVALALGRPMPIHSCQADYQFDIVRGKRIRAADLPGTQWFKKLRPGSAVPKNLICYNPATGTVIEGSRAKTALGLMHKEIVTNTRGNRGYYKIGPSIELVPGTEYAYYDAKVAAPSITQYVPRLRTRSGL